MLKDMFILEEKNSYNDEKYDEKTFTIYFICF